MWPFSSSTPAGPSNIPQEIATEPTLSSPDPLAGTSSGYSSSENPRSALPTNRWEATLKDEEQYQAAVYPEYKDVPGCMQIMDEFLMCYALGPQLRNFYRHGHYRDCRWKWADFKYCLSLKSEENEIRRQLWIKRRAEWWARRRVGASSEDVWDRRTVPLENFPSLQREEIPHDQVPLESHA